MRFKDTQILTSMNTTGMIPVFYQPNPAIATEIIDACYKGGARVFEFTNRGDKAFEVFSELTGFIKKYPDAILGIGTIMNESDTTKYIDAGADFVVSPILKTEMGEVCLSRNVPWIPGCATLTEMVTAYDEGASIVKMFPGSVLGPGFVSAIRPVVPSINVMPTGGVESNEENLRSWFDAGVFCVGMGSQLIKAEYIKTKNWDKLQQDVERVLGIISKVRSENIKPQTVK